MPLANLPRILCADGFLTITIWTIGLITMGALTIKDFLPLLDEYKHNNIATQVGVLVQDDNFQQPRLVGAMPFYKREDDDLMAIARHLINKSQSSIVCGELEKEGWDVWKGADLSKFQSDGLESLQCALSLLLVEKIFKTFDTDKKNLLDKEWSPWNRPLVSAAINFFFYRQDYDYTLKPYKFPASTQAYLVEMMDSLNDTSKLDLLYDQVLKMFCQHIHFKDITIMTDFTPWTMLNTSCEDLILGSDVPSAIDPMAGLWVSFPHLKGLARKTYSFTLLDSDIFSWTEAQNPMPFRIYPGIQILLASVRVDRATFSLAYLYQTDRQGRGLNITIRYGIQVRAKDTRPGRAVCINETSEVCYTKCTKLSIIDKCKCVPFVFKTGLIYDHTLPYCNYALYTACNLSDTVLTSTNDQCLDKCKESCEFTTFNWQISHESYDPVGLDNKSSEFNVIIVPMVTTFTEFTWTVKNTPEQFLSQMGGIVNFYLGFSGLSAFQFLIIVIDFLKRWWSRKGKDSEGVSRRVLSMKKRVLSTVEPTVNFPTQSEMCDSKFNGSEMKELKRTISNLQNKMSEIQARIQKIENVIRQQRI